jgi:hypothetical protein
MPLLHVGSLRLASHQKIKHVLAYMTGVAVGL